MKICPEIQRLGNIFKKKEIDSWFARHSQQCEECRFIITYKLAIAESLLTTDRVLDEECLPREAFFEILLGMTFMIKKAQESKIPLPEELAGKMFWIADPSVSFLAALCHIKECNWCNDYYAALCSTMLRAQERYERAVSQGNRILVSTTDSSRRISASQVFFHDKDFS